VSPLPAGDTARVTLGELYRGFLHAGARGFGGAMPWARRMLVEERRWLTAQEFTDVFSLCNFLPGPNIVSVSVIVGSRLAGPRGAVTAFAGLLTVPLAGERRIRSSLDANGDAGARGAGLVAG
jgi:chromate transporter